MSRSVQGAHGAVARRRQRVGEWLLVGLAGWAGISIGLGLALLAVFAPSGWRVLSVASVVLLVSALLLVPRAAVHRMRQSDLALNRLHEERRRQSHLAEHERHELSQWVVDRVAQDPLTGLLNRAAFLQRLAMLPAEMPVGTTRTIFVLDLAQFAAYNQTHGAAAGDQMLVAVAARFASALRPEDLVARIDGNSFAALLQRVPRELTHELVRRVQRAVASVYAVSNFRQQMGSACGLVCLDSGDAVGPAEELRRAEIALRNAKATARPVVEFEPSLEIQTRERLRFYADITHALANDEFTLAYQPIVDTRTRRMAGVEALMRWHHPVRGTVSPAEFIPVAEASGQIVDMGLWALQTACRQQRWWRFHRDLDLVMAVNLSARQLSEPDAVSRIAAAILHEVPDPRRVKLEITESLVMEDTTSAVALLRELRALGVRLSVDDFGTGFSSLSRLSELPIDELKIDRYFVAGIGCEGPRETILAAALGMAHGLGLTVVAEGVETEEQLQYLEAHGCEYVQGFLHSPAVAPDEITQLAGHQTMPRVPRPRAPAPEPVAPGSPIPALLPSQARPLPRRLLAR